jgi:hypothetical protein
MMEAALLESTVYEYRGLLELVRGKAANRLDGDALIQDLSNAHDWTDAGARAIVSLANDYGTFMLRNALALAIALDKEDGDLGF